MHRQTATAIFVFFPRLDEIIIRAKVIIEINKAAKTTEPKLEVNSHL